MAVKGIETFKKIFFGVQRELYNYWWNSRSIILRDATMRPRATKNIDMILVVDHMTPEFGRQFWQFIKDGV